MLTEQFLKDNLITAYFIDNDRQNIEITLRSEDKKSVFTEITPFDENNEQYKILTKFISLDELHENTYQKKKDERREFEEEVIRIAKRDGLLTVDKIKPEEYFSSVINYLTDNKSNEDQLFALKISVFENDTIINSDNNDIKKKIRQATTKPEVMLNALKIICGE